MVEAKVPEHDGKIQNALDGIQKVIDLSRNEKVTRYRLDGASVKSESGFYLLATPSSVDLGYLTRWALSGTDCCGKYATKIVNAFLNRYRGAVLTKGKFSFSGHFNGKGHNNIYDLRRF
jgi:hypothetical protein